MFFSLFRSKLKLNLSALSNKVFLVVCTNNDEHSYFNLTIKKSSPDYELILGAPIQFENYLPVDIQLRVADQKNTDIYKKALMKGEKDLAVTLNIQQALFLKLALMNTDFKLAERPPLMKLESEVRLFALRLGVWHTFFSYTDHFVFYRNEPLDLWIQENVILKLK